LDKNKIGRPTDKPKTTQLAIRFDKETLQILDEYCSLKKISRAEGVRKAVRTLPKK
jgi:metal-responsive CopG/Arc/MetJ family transcriptional regulator